MINSISRLTRPKPRRSASEDRSTASLVLRVCIHADLQPRRAGRTATTLVEVVGTLSVLLVLAVSAVGILGSITEIGVRTNHAKQGRSSIERLAKSFRDDVHEARDVDLSQQQSLVMLKTDTATVLYEWDADQHTIRRTVSDGENRLAVERYQLTDRCSPEVSVNDERVTLALTSGAPTIGLQPWIIEARAP